MGNEPLPAPAMPQDISLFVWLWLIATLVAMAGRRLKVPYALALVITGLIIGAPHLLPRAHLDPHTLFTLFLPPLLFESAINLRVEPLRRNWQPIALYALGGTLIAAGVSGLLMARVFYLPLPVALVLGAILAPTDPISVIAVFKRFGVGKRLSLLVEAESLFNDGVAVVLFGLLLGAALGSPFSAGRVIQDLGGVVIGGAGVGLGIGALASRVTREVDEHLLEIMLTTLVAFGPYLLAEAVHVSGVIAVVTAGLVVGNYGMRTGMSPTTRLAVTSFWEYAAFAVNSLVFLLLGIEVTLVNLWSRIDLVLGAAAVVLMGRGAAVYGLSLLVNKRKAEVPRPWQHVLFWGGLHGALSMALVMGLPPDFPERETLVVLTFGVVLFSLLVQGLTIGPLLQWLGLTERSSSASQYRRLASENLACQAALKELEQLAAAGTLPRMVCDPVAEGYRQRLSALEAEIETLHLDDAALKGQQLREASRLAILAEKSALHESQRNGLLPEEDLRPLVERLDARLAELQLRGEEE